MKSDTADRIVEIVRGHGVLRPRDLEEHRIPREYLRRLCSRGILRRVARGLYTLENAETNELHSFAEVAKRVPTGVICLLSALRFHELTTQSPFQVWVAIDTHARAPQAHDLPIRIVRFSGSSLSSHVQEHNVEGVTVRVYSPAKTVADCFKFRKKVGMDVAIEALRDCLRQRKATPSEIWEAAKTCRITSIIRPYLEALA